jgi:hypothetical protein
MYLIFLRMILKFIDMEQRASLKYAIITVLLHRAGIQVNTR